ncbi:MAG: hypothetical protein ABFD92_05780 [Planctomycetaceae bacterium]|nr:hypothetical protein [Planctomycetaceae bacterium]
MKQKKAFSDFAGTGKLVRFTRRFAPEHLLNGYVLRTGRELILVHMFDDFKGDGYSIVRQEDIEDFRQSQFEDWFDHMLRSEGLLGGLKIKAEIDLTDMHSAIQSVSRSFEQMIIECESEEGDANAFYIGKAVSIAKTCIQFSHYDALGFWSQRPETIQIPDITVVQFDTPYIRTFSKYLRPGQAPKSPQ